MFCTVCEITTTDLSHYRSQLHIVNLKRKISGCPPLTIEEFDSDSQTDDLSLKLNLENSLSNEKSFKRDISFKPKTNKKCIICEGSDSLDHYREHGFADEQIFYLKNKQCFICYEKFFEDQMLLKHLDSENHRTAVTDGVSLYLENGKILNPNKKLIPVKVVIKSEPTIKLAKKEEKIVEKTKEYKENEKLIVSIANNNKWGKFMH